jgi:hypothetical protein
MPRRRKPGHEDLEMADHSHDLQPFVQPTADGSAMMGTTGQPVAPVKPLLHKAFWEADGNRTRQGTFVPSSDLKSVTSTRHAVASTRQASDPYRSSDHTKGQPTADSFQVTFDSSEPTAHAAFWADALGYSQQPPPPDFASWEYRAQAFGIPEDEWGDTAAIIDLEGSGPRMLFLRVPEPKTAKNRMHLDINISKRGATPQERRVHVDVEVERLIVLGATTVGSFDEDKGVWTVMLDPEGNEF